MDSGWYKHAMLHFVTIFLKVGMGLLKIFMKDSEIVNLKNICKWLRRLVKIL